MHFLGAIIFNNNNKSEASQSVAHTGRTRDRAIKTNLTISLEFILFIYIGITIRCFWIRFAIPFTHSPATNYMIASTRI